jgi:hypothetical protein
MPTASVPENVGPIRTTHYEVLGQEDTRKGILRLCSGHAHTSEISVAARDSGDAEKRSSARIFLSEVIGVAICELSVTDLKASERLDIERLKLCINIIVSVGSHFLRIQRVIIRPVAGIIVESVGVRFELHDEHVARA